MSEATPPKKQTVDLGGETAVVHACPKCGVCPGSAEDCANPGDHTCPYFGKYAVGDPALIHISRYDLSLGLRESLKLQSHYAESLNHMDGGQRRTFSSPSAWLNRLYDVGRLKGAGMTKSAIFSSYTQIDEGLPPLDGNYNLILRIKTNFATATATWVKDAAKWYINDEEAGFGRFIGFEQEDRDWEIVSYRRA